MRKLAIITYGAGGGFKVGSKLSLATCAENPNIYKKCMHS